MPPLLIDAEELDVSTRIPSEELLDLIQRAHDTARKVTMLPGMTENELAAVELQTNMLLPFAVRERNC